MEEKKLVERPLMDEREFEEYLEKNRVDLKKEFYEKGIIHPVSFEAIRRFKSVRRAIRRGHVSLDCIIYPHRPFNNRANTCGIKDHNSRVVNERKKYIYGQLSHRKSA